MWNLLPTFLFQSSEKTMDQPDKDTGTSSSKSEDSDSQPPCYEKRQCKGCLEAKQPEQSQNVKKSNPGGVYPVTVYNDIVINRDDPEYLDRESGHIIFTFLPLVDPGVRQYLDWEAYLCIRPKSIPYLMKNGFNISEANLRRELGYMGGANTEVWSTLSCKTWSCSRTYLLTHETDADADADTDDPDMVILDHTVEDSQWTAKLRVYGSTLGVLSRFRIHHLTVDKVVKGGAWNDNGDLVYQFSSELPEESVNVYYDDMPMSGLWPWPRRARTRHG